MKGEIAVRYTIRHFDLPLFTFEANMDSADTGLHIIKVYEENRSFLPLNLTVSEDGVERWLRHRAIPKNRAYVDALLSKVGLSLNVMHSISPPTKFCKASRVLSSSISFGSSIGRSARTLIFSSFIVCLQIKTGQSKWIVL